LRRAYPRRHHWPRLSSRAAKGMAPPGAIPYVSGADQNEQP
jgi:hypothetical protein